MMTRGRGRDDDRKGWAVQPPLNKVQAATHVSLATHTRPTLVPDKPTPQPAILGTSSVSVDGVNSTETPASPRTASKRIVPKISNAMTQNILLEHHASLTQ